jgi:hypothetical protein
MITMWLVRTRLVGLLLGLSALAAERVLGWFGRPRRWVWVAAMAGWLAIPGVALVAPSLVPSPRVAGSWIEWFWHISPQRVPSSVVEDGQEAVVPDPSGRVSASLEEIRAAPDGSMRVNRYPRHGTETLIDVVSAVGEYLGTLPPDAQFPTTFAPTAISSVSSGTSWTWRGSWSTG